MKTQSISTLILAVLIIGACTTQPDSVATPEAPVDMPNPASVHCVDEGGELEIRDEAGGQVGYCLFPDGSECEEWAFFRGECAPGGTQEGAGSPDPAIGTSAEVTRYDKGYRFEQNGWVYLHIEGEPDERGFQHGYLLAPELAEILGNFKDLTYWDTGKEWEFFVDQAVKQFAERIDPEYLHRNELAGGPYLERLRGASGLLVAERTGWQILSTRRRPL
jgi:putative hemolysin